MVESCCSLGDASAEVIVGIILCTFNGEKYLRRQLESFERQTHRNWVLYVSDDGSTDGTRDILRAYQSTIGDRIFVCEGPRKGFAQNFMSLLRRAEVKCDYYAFSDQDDIWLPDKLERSLAALRVYDAALPALYCSRTTLIDEYDEVIGYSPPFRKSPGFRNALVQSLAGANTMLINGLARDLLLQIEPHAVIVAHDWLAYLMVSGSGGVVVYDERPTLLYRQHANNVIGANVSLLSRMSRVVKMLGGRFKHWNECNVSILRTSQCILSKENLKVLEGFDLLRSSSVLKRVGLALRLRLYRQTVLGNISLYAAIFLNKV